MSNHSQLPRSGFEIALEIIAAAILLIFALYLVTTWSEIPERVPGHFDASGTPDRWDNKDTLIILPLIALFLYGILSAVCFFSFKSETGKYPQEKALARFHNNRLMLSFLKVEIMLIFAYVGFRTIEIAEGASEGLGPAFLPVFLLIIFGTVTYFLLRLKKI